MMYQRLAIFSLCFIAFVELSLVAAGQEQKNEAGNATGSDDNVAVVIEIKGAAWLNDENSRLEKLDRIPAGDLTIDNGGSVLVAFLDSGNLQRLTVNEKVTTQIADDGATDISGLKITEIPGQIPPNTLKALPANSRAGAGQARSAVDPPGPLVTPIHESIINSQTPTLNWTATSGAASYQVTVAKAGIGRKVFSGTAPDNKITVDKKLKPGKYTWKVMTVAGDQQTEVLPYIVNNETIPKQFNIPRDGLKQELDGLSGLADANSDNAGVLEFCAERVHQLGEYNEAIRLYEKLRTLDEDNASVHHALHELYRRGGRLEEGALAEKTAKQLDDNAAGK